MSRPIGINASPDSGLVAVIERWARRGAEYAAVGANVEGKKICELVVAELEALARGEHQESVTLRQASELGGYSYDHLQREVKAGRIPNLGAQGRPRIPRNAVPVKPGYVLRPLADGDQVSARRRIVASVIHTPDKRSA